MDYANTVEDALKRFYSAGEHDAHSWLLQIQTSLEAWDFVWYLLHSSKSWEVQLFAANTLYSKISKQWTEVPKTDYEALRNRLISVIKQPNVPKLICNRLCQSLAAFFANSSAVEQKDTNKCVLDQLTEIFPCNEPATLNILLQILSAFPGEFEKRNAVMKTIVRGLLNSWCKVMWLLLQVFSTCNDLSSDKAANDLYILGLECALNWLKMGQFPLDVTVQIFPQFLQASSRYISSKQNEDENSKGFDMAQECLTVMITNDELHKRPQILWSWAKDLICMVEEHGGKYYYELLTTMGETHSRALLLALINESKEEQKWVARKLIDLLLQCSNEEGRYPTEERYSTIPFGFWYTLQDDVITLDQPLDSQAMQALKPIYVELTQILLRKSALPRTSSEAGNSDDRELFRCYRQDIADTYIYCYSVLGEDLLLLLGQRLSKPIGDPQDWTFIESNIFAFKSLSESVGTQENYYVPAVMNLILEQIQYDNYPKQVLACACSTVGAYSEWIGEKVDPWLEKSIRLITRGLTNCPITSPPASMALKDITRECAAQLEPLAPSILDTISNTLPTISASSCKGEGCRLMYTAGKLINTLSSTEQQLRYLDATLGFCIRNLQQYLQEPIVTGRNGAVSQLKMIKVFVSTLEGPIRKLVLDGLLPIFNQIISHPDWSVDDPTLEAMLTCAHVTLVSVSYPEVDAKLLVPILSTSYKTKPHPATLNLLNSLILLFGKDSYVMGPIFVEMSSLTLAGVAACQAVNGNLSDLSDLLEVYLKMLAQICKRNMNIFIENTNQIPQMLRCAMSCLTLPESGPRRSAGSFLMHAIMQKRHLETFVQPIGQELVCVILQCIGGKVPRNDLEHHAEVLLALNKTYPELTAQWLRNGLFDASGPTALPEQKEIFLNAVAKERTKWRLIETLKSFSLQCRQGFLFL